MLFRLGRPISLSSRLPSQRPQLYCRHIVARMASTLPRLPVFEAISRHDPASIGVLHSVSGRKFSYGELLHDVADTKARLRSLAGRLDGQRVAFLVENSYDYIGARENQFLIKAAEKPTCF